MPRHSQVTIRDVAVKAGVSHQTVSRVINSNQRVSSATVAKVHKAIQDLGYQPNASARSLAKGQTFVLACISPNLTDYTYAKIIEGAETPARQKGYFMISACGQDEVAFEILIKQLVYSRRTDGLLIIDPSLHHFHDLIPRNIPIVLVGIHNGWDTATIISLNDIKAGELATHHLIDLGHTLIAHITGPAGEDSSRDRKAGYLAALRSEGIEPDPGLIVEGDWSADSGYQGIRQLIDRQVPFTAIFAQNDLMAVGAIHALHEAGMSVPQDASVVGVDDMPLASYFDPPLTTIRQDMSRIGQEAARCLIEAIENPGQAPQHILLPAELILRRSTARLFTKEVA